MNAPCCLAAFALLAAACPSSPSYQQWSMDELTADQGFSFRSPLIEVPAGKEVQYCYFVEVPDINQGQDVWIDTVHLALNPGSHHVNVFRVKTIVRHTDGTPDLDPALGTPFSEGGTRGTVIQDGPCFKPSSGWADWPLVVNSQKSSPTDNILKWKLPDHVAHRFGPGEKLAVQIHYVNATTQTTPYRGKVGINFVKTAAASPIELGTLFATQQSIRVCQSNPQPSFSGSCAFPAGTQLHVAAANGHFHSRGQRFSIYSWDGVSTTRPADAARFYQSLAWDEPPMSTGLDVALPSGGGVYWTCEYRWQRPTIGCDALNAKDPQHAEDCCYTFGPEVEANEHCNAFVYYWPRAAGNVFCN